MAKKNTRFTRGEQIKRELLRYILEGDFTPDQPLPKMTELAEMLGVSNKTVQSAIHLLKAEGIIEAKRGKGVFVKSIQPRTRAGRKIGLLFSASLEYLKGRPHPAEIIEALEAPLEATGYNLVPMPMVSMETITLVESVRKKKLAGLVLFEIDSDRLVLSLQELRLPMVSMDYDVYRFGIPSVVYDNTFGTFMTTKALIKAGHRHIAYLRFIFPHQVGNNEFMPATEAERIQGYRIAMQDAELPMKIVEHHPLGVKLIHRQRRQSMREMMLELMGSRPAPTAIVCPSDWAAFDVMKEAGKLGFRIPDDLSIVGFGDGGRRTDPDGILSSIRVDAKGMGHHGARMLLKDLRGEVTDPELVTLPVSFVQRSSIATLSTSSVNQP